MATIVQKYGGSSLADVTALQRVATEVVKRQRAGNRMVVVVSAMGKSTDALLDMAMAISPDPSRRELDMLVSVGERTAMALLSMAIETCGGRAISFTGSQSGIITTNQHQGARIVEVRPHRIEQSLKEGRIVIVAGYQGVSTEREITTLGRGGTDTSAVALAAALGAACEIYSDVDGVYSADPGVCGEAHHLSELSYEVMEHMAAAGARVLNREAVRFARQAGIVIRARRTGEAEGRETVVGSGEAALGRSVTAIVDLGHVSRVVWRPEAHCGEVLDAVARRGGRVMHVWHHQGGEAWVDRTDIPGRAAEALTGLAGVDAVDSGAVISLVGVSDADIVDVLQESSVWLTDQRIGVKAVHGGWGGVRFVIEETDTPAVVRGLHRRWIGGTLEECMR